MDQLLGSSVSVLWAVGTLLGTVALALIVHAVVFWGLQRATQRTGSDLDDAFVRRSRAPARALLPVLALMAVVSAVPIPDSLRGPLEHALGLGLIASIAWLLISVTRVLEDIVALRYPMDVSDNLAARRVQTQTRVLQRVGSVVIVVVALSIGLMTFPTIRHLGTSLLASAGLAGLVVGMAMRPTLSNLIAGLQIAITEPIRIDDVVIVEGEWGRIEEIAGSFVVVCIWDLRRLMVPLTYFIEKPFQNWTRVTADLIGTVFLYVDYRVRVEDVRAQLKRILDESGMWDGKTWGVQVTNADARSMELRALMSAPDSGSAWNLRCHVRERLIAWVQETQPDALPRIRAELSPLPGTEQAS
jgi:small-conductance mechanosensitive channel